MLPHILTFIGVLILAVSVAWGIRAGAKGRYDSLNRLLEEERQANATRKKNIDPQYFYTPDVSGLPVADETAAASPQEEKLLKLQKRVLQLAEEPMMRLPEPMTNTQIKLAFGAAHLETVTAGESRYNAYAEALTDWAAALAEAGQPSSAQQILETAIAMDTGHTRPILLLADIYSQTGNKKRLHTLMQTVDALEQLFGKDKALTYIRQLL